MKSFYATDKFVNLYWNCKIVENKKVYCLFKMILD